MSRPKSKHPEAEALFSGPEVPSLSEQAANDREVTAQAGREKTANLRSQRLAKEATDREAASDKSAPVNKPISPNDT